MDEVQKVVEYPVPNAGSPLAEVTRDVMSSTALASKAWITNQYDYYVLGNTALSFPDDAGMVRVDEESGLGFAVSTDANGRYCQLDPYAGAQLALDIAEPEPAIGVTMENPSCPSSWKALTVLVASIVSAPS